MIPADTTQSLLKTLLNDLVTPFGEPDYNRFRPLEMIERKFTSFCDVLIQSEDDLEVVMVLMENDPDCQSPSPVRRLQSLVDYVKIACAIYDPIEPQSPGAVYH